MEEQSAEKKEEEESLKIGDINCETGREEHQKGIVGSAIAIQLAVAWSSSCPLLEGSRGLRSNATEPCVLYLYVMRFIPKRFICI
jgi:hypothetical protein